MAAAIDWAKIGKLLWVAPLAGMAVALTFSLVILGVGRASDARREGAGGLAAVYTAMAGVALTVFAGVVVYGLDIITTK